MPVSEQTPVNSYTGNGVTTVFAYTFKIIAAADIEVTVDGVVKTLTTDYSVSGVGADGGGNVTFISAPANGTTVVIQRAMAYERATDYQENGDLPAQTLDDDLDRGVMLLQQLKATLTRSIKLPAGETTEQVIAESAAARALKLLGFDAGGDVTVYGAADVDLATVSAYMLTLLDDATAADARATLGAWGGASADIASAATLDLTAATGNIVRITGTTATSAVTLNNGQYVICYAAGAWPLTYHATNNPVPGGADYTCAAGDLVIYSKNNSGEISVQIVPKDGGSVVGKVRGALTLTGTISPSQITADQNDYSPTGLSGASVIRITTDSTLRTITGLAGGSDGRVICIDYLSGSGLKLVGNSTSSTAANRFDIADVTLTAPCIAVLKYDATSSRWRALAVPSSGSATITLGTPQDTTSGTSIDFTSIPSGTKMIVVSLYQVSTSGTSSLVVQFGDSGGIETTGYECAHWSYNGTGHAEVNDGCRLHNAVAAAGAYDCHLKMTLVDSSTNTWVADWHTNNENSAYGYQGICGKSLSAGLDRIRLTTTGGTDTFDGGKINILYFG